MFFLRSGADPNMAAVEVQNRVASASGFFLQKVTRAGCLCKKAAGRKPANLFSLQ